MRYLSRILFAMCGAALLALGWSGSVSAQSIVGSAHDILAHTSGTAVFAGTATPVNQICVFCHTPHNAQVADAPLWNRSAPTTTAWSMYASNTMDATVPVAPEGVSLACLSCHDGATALDAGTGVDLTANATLNPTLPQAIPATTANFGSDLSNDHPISVDYTQDASLVAPSGNLVGGVLPLFAGTAAQQVECGSCHDPHDTTNFAFLRISNNQAGNPSALCQTCHAK